LPTNTPAAPLVGVGKSALVLFFSFCYTPAAFSSSWLQKLLYQFHFATVRRRLFTLRENKLFFTEWPRSFNMELILEGWRMNRKWIFRSVAWLGFWGSCSALCYAAPPWELASIKPVDADPDKMYPVTEENGPWVIMACSFSGDGSEKQAQELVYELRKRYKLPAYTYKGHFDLGQAAGRGTDQYGAPKKFKYLKQDTSHLEVDEVAVLVGNFSSEDDSDAQKVLKKLWYAEPKCLEVKEGKETHQTYSDWHAIYQQVQVALGEKKTTKGPMGHAFIATNPLLPPDFFVARGSLDQEVLAMNAGVPFCLLDCPGKYTVQVATFKGHVIIKQDEIKEIEEGRKELESKLGEAAQKADTLTKALRAKGYEAYQFHDRCASIVTIGSFNSVGTPRTDGKTEINPDIHKIMKLFAAETIAYQGTPVTKLQTVVGIPCDVQPLPVMVPKRSISVAMRKDVDQ
jgi:hypothetical protein